MPEPDRPAPASRTVPSARLQALRVGVLCLPFLLGSHCSEGGDLQVANRTATDEMRMSVVATSREAGEVAVSARLCCTPEYFGRGGDALRLGREEGLAAALGGRRRTLQRSGSSDAYRYTFAGVATGSPFEFVYYRTDGSKLRSTSRMPTDFEVTYPRSGEVFDVTDEIVLEWTPRSRYGGDVMVIRPRIECQRLDGRRFVRSFYWQVPDDGQFVYDLSRLPEATNDDLDRRVDCSLSFGFSRSEYRSIAPPYRSGSIETTVVRTLDGVVIRL